MKSPLFYAKILLFGEYGIMENSKGLTLPYSFYRGCLKFSDLENDFEKKSNSVLKSFSSYLEKIDIPETFRLDTDLLKKDLSKGMFFDSNIPQGYGIGSSGALVAAIFDRYSLVKRDSDNIKKEELAGLRENFGLLESYFHGKSSGVDPLICYMNLPILIENKQSVDKVSLTIDGSVGGAIFLIDSGKKRETGAMVEIFFEKLKNDGFRNTLREEFIKYNNACIEAFLKKDISPFFKNLKELSKWVYRNFKPMIPESLFRVWKRGIESNVYYLKLCGGGGGGYTLGFTRDYEKTEKMLKNFRKELIYRF